MHSRTFAVVAVLGVLSAGGLSAERTPPARPAVKPAQPKAFEPVVKNGLSVSVRATKTVTPCREPIVLDVTLKNVSKQAFMLSGSDMLGWVPGGRLTFGVTAVASGKVQTLHTGMNPMITAPVRLESKALAPGKSVVVKAVITSWTWYEPAAPVARRKGRGRPVRKELGPDILPPGRYRITVTAMLGRGPMGLRRRAGGGQAAEQTTPFWTGEITSKPVEVRVGPNTEATAAGATGPVKVFLLMGQSNMNGRGNIGVLKDKLTKDLPDKYPPSLVKMRDDVWITGANGNGISNQMSNVRLEPGFGQFKYYGPELAFGHAMGDHYKEKVLLIKIIAGGTALATHWTSPGAARRTNRQGPLKGRRAGFQTAFYKTKKALDSLPKLIKGYDPKQGYQIMGIVWVHGNADGGRYSKEYEDNLVDFIVDLRAMFALPGLPFIAVESLSSRAPGSAFKNATDRVNKQAGNTRAAAIITKSRIDLRGDKAYSVYNASGDGTHWRHNARA